MELVRTWVRWTSTALGASLLVPAAVVIVAAGVAIGGGGLGGLGALGQLVEGPRDPLAAVRALDPADDTLAADPSALIASTPAGTSRGGRDVGSGGEEGGAGGGDAPGGGTPGDGGGGGGGGGDRDEGDGGGSPGGGGDGPAQPPESDPGPLAPVREGTEPLVDQLPEPVGPLSGDLIDQVVELGEQVLGTPRSGGLLGGTGGSR